MGSEIGYTIIIGIIILIAWLAITYFLLRWVFSLKRQLWNQKAQINLLIKIANKLGVLASETEIIEQRNNDPRDHFLN